MLVSAAAEEAQHLHLRLYFGDLIDDIGMVVVALQ